MDNAEAVNIDVFGDVPELEPTSVEGIPLEQLAGEEVEPEESTPEPTLEERLAQIESESAKFQSLRDQDKAKYEKELSEWSNFKTMMEQRPDLVQQLAQGLTNKPSEAEIDLGEAGFDPYEAYEKPDSASYKLRKREEQATIDRALQEYTAALTEQLALNDLRGEVRNPKHGLTDEQAQAVESFYTTPKKDLPVDIVIEIVKKLNKGTGTVESVATTLDEVRKAKGLPPSAGSQPSVGVAPAKEEDQVWEAIKAADKATHPW